MGGAGGLLQKLGFFYLLFSQLAFGNTREEAVVILLWGDGDEKYKINPASKKEKKEKKSLFKKTGCCNLKEQSIHRIVIQNFLVEMGSLAKTKLFLQRITKVS
jgi:hypothetical protein